MTKGERALSILAQKGPMTTPEIAAVMKMGQSSISNQMRRYLAIGIVKTVGYKPRTDGKRGAVPKVLQVTEEGLALLDEIRRRKAKPVNLWTVFHQRPLVGGGV